MGDDRQSEQRFSETAASAPVAARPCEPPDHPTPSGRWISKLRFFRAMLWVLVYATAVLLVMSVIIFEGLRLPSKILGGVLVLALVLIAATYGWQWYR